MFIAEMLGTMDEDYLLLRTNKTLFVEREQAFARMEKVTAYAYGKMHSFTADNVAKLPEVVRQSPRGRSVAGRIRQEFINHFNLTLTYSVAWNFKVASYYHWVGGVYLPIDKEYVEQHRRRTLRRVEEIIGEFS